MSYAQELPVVSVVVIGRNEGARLIRCLESVRAMRAPGEQVELIYIDSASTDGSPERAAACGALVSSLALASALPLVVLLGVSAGIIVRTAAKARWKSSDRWTLLLYSLHSHVQQVPILFGQLCYPYDRWRGRHRGLIEDEEAPR